MIEKEHVMISIDSDIRSKAKDAQINISAVAEKAVREKLGMKEIQIKDICEFCGRNEVKASKATNYIGLTWLCPDEKWICDSCLHSKMKNVSAAI